MTALETPPMTQPRDRRRGPDLARPPDLGQRAVVEQVRVALDAAHMDGRKFDHALLCGPPGVRKTQTAKVVAQEMAADFHEVLQAVQSPADLNALLLGARDRDVILVDEAHELDREYQTGAVPGLDQRRLLLPVKGRTLQAVLLADFTLLLATTDEFKLLQPLRDRMAGPAVRVLLAGRTGRPDPARRGGGPRRNGRAAVAARSRGTPRLALRLLQAVHRVCRSEGRTGSPPPTSTGRAPGRDRRPASARRSSGTSPSWPTGRAGWNVPPPAGATDPHRRRGDRAVPDPGRIAKDDQGRRHLTAEGRGPPAVAIPPRRRLNRGTVMATKQVRCRPRRRPG